LDYIPFANHSAVGLRVNANHSNCRRLWPRIEWEGNAPGVEPSADAWLRHWSRCIEDASAADVCLFVNNAGERACGALVELGAALGTGKQVFVVSPDWWSFANHPRCRVFKDIAGAIEAICAMQAGEQMRQEVMATPPERVAEFG
jgi:hypothetical protein